MALEPIISAQNLTLRIRKQSVLLTSDSGHPRHSSKHPKRLEYDTRKSVQPLYPCESECQTCILCSLTSLRSRTREAFQQCLHTKMESDGNTQKHSQHLSRCHENRIMFAPFAIHLKSRIRKVEFLDYFWEFDNMNGCFVCKVSNPFEYACFCSQRESSSCTLFQPLL